MISENEQSQTGKHQRAKKMMLWVGMVSMTMTFAGLTSAYVVSKGRPDWLADFELPRAFYYSLAVVMSSSITFMLARFNIKRERSAPGMLFLLSTFALGGAFILLQLRGFDQIMEAGWNYVNVTTSFIYVIVLLHIAHIVGGLVALLVVIINHFRKKYDRNRILGVQLAEMFWHFVGVLWLYLFLFFQFA